MQSHREFKEEALPIRDHQELRDLTVENILLIQGSRAEGKSPKQLDLAEKTGVLVIAIRREEKLLLHRLAFKQEVDALPVLSFLHHSLDANYLVYLLNNFHS